jgi:hypothetical protein
MEYQKLGLNFVKTKKQLLSLVTRVHLGTFPWLYYVPGVLKYGQLRRVDGMSFLFHWNLVHHAAHLDNCNSSLLVE